MIHVFSPFWRNQEGIYLSFGFQKLQQQIPTIQQQEQIKKTNREEEEDQPRRKGVGKRKKRKRRRKNGGKSVENEIGRSGGRIVHDNERRPGLKVAVERGPNGQRREEEEGGGGGHQKSSSSKSDKDRSEKKKKAKTEDESGSTKKWKRPKNQEEWDTAMDKAMKKLSYGRMEKLFRLSLKWAIARGNTGARREVTKQFRVLSILFHPDKHPEESECYKVAFQALNAAHSEVKAAIID